MFDTLTSRFPRRRVAIAVVAAVLVGSLVVLVLLATKGPRAASVRHHAGAPAASRSALRSAEGVPSGSPSSRRRWVGGAGPRGTSRPTRFRTGLVTRHGRSSDHLVPRCRTEEMEDDSFLGGGLMYGSGMCGPLSTAQICRVGRVGRILANNAISVPAVAAFGRLPWARR